MAKSKSKSENKNKPESKEKRKMVDDKADAPISKKKQVNKAEVPMEIDSAPDQLKVLERKLKKERKKEEKKLKKEKEGRGEPQEQPAKAATSVLALQYLESWNKKQPGWKFRKARQTWLLMHMFDLQKVPNNHFRMLLKYLEGLKGSSRQITIKKAGEYMKEHESRDKRDADDERRMNRIREVLQLLS